MSAVAGDGGSSDGDETDPWREAGAIAGGHRGTMLVDAIGLGFTAHRGRIVVHYPVHDPEGGGASRYGSGFEIGPIPGSYWTNPPNEITRQRVALWRRLLEESSAFES